MRTLPRRVGARTPPRRIGLAAVVAAGTVAALVATAPPAAAVERPEYQMPFACGERWEGSTRSTHSPSTLSVDWNRDAYDSGQPVVASAPGVVTDVVNLGDQSYGRYVIIDHGGGWTTLHAHLLASYVVEGQRVDQGQTIALLGTSGGSTGPHLHYEQRLDRENRHAFFDGQGFVYNSWLTSQNCLDVPVVGDWNGDRLTDVGVFVRRAVEARFRER
nr:M23 family metallopeptidase [Nocardioidaceae bacterium]